jgi:hypothetical protein
MSPEPQPPTAAEGFLIIASLILFAAVWAVIAQRGRMAGRHAVLRHLAGLFGGSAVWFLAMLLGIGVRLPGTVASVSMIAALLMLPKLTAISAQVGNIRAEWLRFKAETKDAWRQADAQTAQEARARREAEESRLREEREERERQRLIALETLPERLRLQRERAAASVRELCARRDLEKSARLETPNHDDGIRLLRSPMHDVSHRGDGGWDGSTAAVGPERVTFTYEDAFGNVTDREVVVHRADRQCFAGYCMERQAERTFRYDRIVGEVVRTDTGEALSAKAWMRELTR